ncbi:MAG: 50S ribosomal protein L3 [Holosporales bacterium]|jgi:large subunit ribosomal protein L3|nr:50S ribosomal protein L3 [Holosporales bacterium]
MRTGLIAEKIGMTQFFTAVGVQVPVTVLKIDKCTVLENKTQDSCGYTAVKLGARPVASNKLSKPVRGYYAKKEIEGQKIMKEFRVTEDCLLTVGDVISASYFEAGQLVDVTGVSKGKGFAGSMKRHGFGGLRATHGVSISHRSHGSTGNRTKPGKVFKNKRMAGHMGHERVTTLSLTVYSVDADRDLLFVKGCVPGPKGGLVFVRDAVKAVVKAK